MTKNMIRAAVKGAYDLQKLRIQTGLRLVSAFKQKLGQMPSQTEDNIDDEQAVEMLEVLRLMYKRITDAITQEDGRIKRVTEKMFKQEDLISNESEYALVRNYVQLLEDETKMFKDIAKMVEKHPLWNGFLKDVKGCGTALAAIIISEFDIHKADYPSSLWKYSGYDTVRNNETGTYEGRSRKKHHLEDSTYIDAEGNEKTKKGITYNPWLKTKMYLLATSFIKVKGHYREIYDGYKHRLANNPDHASKTKAHINNMALRYIIKIFMIDLHREWRTIEGLSVPEPYHVAKLGLRNHAEI